MFKVALIESYIGSVTRIKKLYHENDGTMCVFFIHLLQNFNVLFSLVRIIIRNNDNN